MVVSRVEGEPATIQEHLVPRAEIHRGWIGWNADVAEVARAVAGRDVHASGKRHGKMGKIPADAAAFLVALRRGAVTPGMVVAEFNAVVGVVADRLRSLPSAPVAAEERPGEVRKLLGVAVATCQQEGEDVTRQRRYVPLMRGRANLIRQAAILDDELAADFEQSRRCDAAEYRCCHTDRSSPARPRRAKTASTDH